MGEHCLRVLLVTDRPRTSNGLSAMLERGGIDVCADVDTPASAVSVVLAEHPDVCLVDADLTEDALMAVTMITRRVADAPVVMLGRDPTDDEMFDAIAAGASGFLPEDLPAARLVPALRDVSRGESAFPRRLLMRVVATLRQNGALVAR